MRLRLRRTFGAGVICLVTACGTASVPAARPAVRPAAPVDAPAPVLRIMPLGDSITYGLGSTDRGGYRAALGRRLARAGYRVDFVGSRAAGPLGADDDNEGHGGWTIEQIAAGVDGWLAAYRPDVVLLHIGTNDLYRPHRADAPARLGRLLDRIRRDAPAVRILVARIVGSRKASLQRRVDRYNADVARMVAARRDPLLYLVDQGGVLAPDVHPDDIGYAAMADNWFAAIAGISGLPAEPAPPGMMAAPAPGITPPSRTVP